MREKEYNELIEETISFVLSKKNKNIFLSDEEYKFFQIDFTKPKKRNKATISMQKKITSLQLPKKIPITFPSIREANKKEFLKKKSLIKKSLIKKPFKKEFSEKEPSKKELSKDEFIILEKPSASFNNSENIKKILKKISPNLKIRETPYDDTQAKNIASIWKIQKKANIIILSFKESPQKFLFLQNLSKALDIYFYKTEIISSIKLEKENKWPIFLNQNLKLIIACDYFVFNCPNLIKYYKEVPSKKEHYLKNIPLFMLPDISVYFKNPLLKHSLWNGLKKMLKNL